MDTEVLVTDQTVDKHVEEMKVSDQVKHVDEESVSQAKDFEGKPEEEKIKAEDLKNMEEPPSDQEEKLEDKKSDTMAEEVKDEPASEVIEKEPARNSETFLVQESESEEAKKTTEDPETSIVQESESEEAKEPAELEALTEEMRTKEEISEFSAAIVPESETEDRESESLIESSVPASDITVAPDTGESAETSQDKKTVDEEVEVIPEPSEEEPSSNDAPDLTIAAPEVEGKIEKAVEGENPVSSETIDANMATEVPEVSPEGETIEKSEEIKDESLEDDKKISVETSKDLDAPTEVAEVSSEGDGIEKVEENKSEGLEDDKKISAETSEYLVAATGVSEVPYRGGVQKDEENKGETIIQAEEKIPVDTSEDLKAAIEAEVSTKGGGIGELEEHKSEKLEDDEKILVETSEGLDVATDVSELLTEGEKAASGGIEVVEGKDNTTIVETWRDLNVDSTPKEPVSDSNEVVSELKPTEEQTNQSDAPKQEAPAKPPQRQSNSIMSKVKQSIVKVKKAIIGKSPSSKTMASETKSDVKV